VEIEAEFLCREDGEDIREDLRPLVESIPEALVCVALGHLRLEPVHLLFRGFGERRAIKLKLLKKVFLIHLDLGNDAEPVAELARKACEAGGMDLVISERREGVPFYEAAMDGGVVERSTLCENCPRNWDRANYEAYLVINLWKPFLRCICLQNLASTSCVYVHNSSASIVLVAVLSNLSLLNLPTGI